MKLKSYYFVKISKIEMVEVFAFSFISSDD